MLGVVYTKGWVVDFILDLVGYAPEANLLDGRIVEPSCGSGAFLVRIVDRLCDCFAAVARSQPLVCCLVSERLTLLGKRLLRERIYQTVWVVVVDLEAGKVTEPDPLMTYDKFVAHLKGWIDVIRA